MRRTQEGYSPFKDDKAKDTENSPFEASSVLVAKAIHFSCADGKMQYLAEDIKAKRLKKIT